MFLLLAVLSSSGIGEHLIWRTPSKELFSVNGHHRNGNMSRYALDIGCPEGTKRKVTLKINFQLFLLVLIAISYCYTWIAPGLIACLKKVTIL
jgi:hypothetical protein